MDTPKYQESVVIRSFVFGKLLDDAEKKNYRRIQALYIAANLKNTDLIPLLDEKRSLDVQFSETIFNDMCYVLAERISESQELSALFQQLFKVDFSEFSYSLGDVEFSIDEWETFRYGKYIKMGNEENYKFSDGEPIFQSRAFAKYLQKRKNALAEFLGISVDSLAKYYHDNLRPRLVIMDDGQERIIVSTKNIYFKTVFYTVTNYLNEHYGCADWAREILFAKNKFKENYGVRNRGWDYYPDLDFIIEKYFQGKIAEIYIKTPTTIEFTRPMIRDEYIPKSSLEDHISICWLYYLDIIFEMVRRMMKKYYTDFSWESVSGESIQKRYGAVVDSYKDLNAKQDGIIRGLKSRIRELEDISESNLVKAEHHARKESDGLRRELLEKDEIIRRLKEQLSWQEQLTYETAKEPTNPDGDDYDKSAIMSKRYLFVGFQEAVSELQKGFPGSVFMTSANAQISGLRVDGVVLLTRFMKHNMYYKVRAEGSLKDIPLIYCNGAGMNDVCEAIWKGAAELF